MLFIAILSRFAVDTAPTFYPIKGANRQISINWSDDKSDTIASSPITPPTATPRNDSPKKDAPASGMLANKPTSYQEVSR